MNLSFIDSELAIIISGDYKLNDWYYSIPEINEPDYLIRTATNPKHGKLYLFQIGHFKPVDKSGHYLSIGYVISHYYLNIEEHYYTMYINCNNIFKTIEEAKDRTDEFLIKLQKLQAFL
jgi:hypothetical protein